MHNTHQQYLISNVKGWAAAIETALKAQHADGPGAHPQLAAERKATILQSLDNLRRDLDQIEPVLREQNQ
jgi:hypothetical protein